VGHELERGSSKFITMRGRWKSSILGKGWKTGFSTRIKEGRTRREEEIIES